MTNLSEHPLPLTKSDLVGMMSTICPSAFVGAVIGRARSRVELFRAFLILVESYDELFWRSPDGAWARFIVKNSPEPNAFLVLEVFEEMERFANGSSACETIIHGFAWWKVCSRRLRMLGFFFKGERILHQTPPLALSESPLALFWHRQRDLHQNWKRHIFHVAWEREISLRPYWHFRRVVHHHSRASPVVADGGSGRSGASTWWWIARLSKSSYTMTRYIYVRTASQAANRMTRLIVYGRESAMTLRIKSNGHRWPELKTRDSMVNNQEWMMMVIVH